MVNQPISPIFITEFKKQIPFLALPGITIITPSFNQGQFLEETILSVLNQHYPKLQYIIIDGGSTDHSVGIIKKYQYKIDYWVSEKDNGQTHAINKGLQKASGEIITWINSDDVLLPGTLQKIATEFEKDPDLYLLHGKSILFGNNKRELIIGKPVTPAQYLAYIPFPQPSSFFRKSIINETGLLDESLHYGMDFELLTRIVLSGKKIKQVNELYSKYRLHDAAKTVDQLSFLEDWSAIFSRTLRSLPQSNELIAHFKTLGLYTNDEQHYPVKCEFSDEFIKEAFCYHLLIQIHTRYQQSDFDRAKIFLHHLKNNFPYFYSRHQLYKINIRIKYFPKPVIRLIRKIKS